MLKRLACATAALSLPGIALTLISERLIRPHLFYTGDWHAEPPDATGWPYEEAHIYTPDGLALQGWFFPAAGATKERPAPTLLFLHGTAYNASDMWVSEERASAFREFLAGIGCNFLIFDYRGYGQSGGAATEEGTYTDAAAALGWLHLRADVDPASIFYYGFSLGSGVATELAIREPSAGLILRAPFTSIRDMIVDWDARFRIALAVAPWLPLTRYDNLSKIRRLDVPLLVMHGDADDTVPEWMGQRLFEAAPGRKRYVVFPGSGHSDISAGLVVPPIAQFVDEVLHDGESRAARTVHAGEHAHAGT